jgi:hypothetical protein
MVRRLHDTTRLVLCGDSTALSGMEQGRPVGTFTRHPSIPVVELLPDGQPPGNGEREHVLIGLRDGVVPDFPAFDWQAPQRSGILVLETSMRKIPKVVCRLLSLHPTAQVVTPLRTGMAGMSGLNAAICRRICGSANPQVGAPVVFLRNATTALGYRALEGETGVIEKVHPARPNRPLAPYLRVSSEDGPVEFTQAEWKSFVGYGHAITTGMAQGGLWDAVVAALPDCSALGRTTIRSVISGARRRCILVVESVAALSGALESKEI